MDDFMTEHLKNLYGLNPNILPYAFQFPRVPPGLTHPSQSSKKPNVKERLTQKNDSINTKLEDFQQMYQKFASGLFDMTFPGIVPPGHPLFSRHHSIETLQSERDKLLKENFELKKQLEKVSKEKSH